MSVDLGRGTQGILTSSNGQQWWCPFIEEAGPDRFRVRIESGWYRDFKRDGTPHPDAKHQQVLVSFVVCDYTDPRVEGLPTEITP